MQSPNIVAGDTNVSTMASDPAAVCRLAVSTFIAQTGLSGPNSQVISEKSVDEQARAITQEWDLGGFSPRLFNAALDASIGIATIAYGHTPAATQLYITLYTVLVLAIDDGACTAEALFAFADKMRHGLPQLHPVLDRVVDILNDTVNHYPAVSAREIIRSTLAFIDSCALEFEVAKLPLRPSAFSYVLAKRQANGIGRAYANFVWDKVHFPKFFTYMQAAPDMEIFIDLVNDVFSFYKEELVGEDRNFVHERARATNRSATSALFDTVDNTVTAVQNVRSILEGTEELVACEAAMKGHVAWHLAEKRYKLEEVLGGN